MSGHFKVIARNTFYKIGSPTHLICSSPQTFGFSLMFVPGFHFPFLLHRQSKHVREMITKSKVRTFKVIIITPIIVMVITIVIIITLVIITIAIIMIIIN